MYIARISLSGRERVVTVTTVRYNKTIQNANQKEKKQLGSQSQ
jgi:hypothetical protein